MFKSTQFTFHLVFWSYITAIILAFFLAGTKKIPIWDVCLELLGWARSNHHSLNCHRIIYYAFYILPIIFTESKVNFPNRLACSSITNKPNPVWNIVFLMWLHIRDFIFIKKVSQFLSEFIFPFCASCMSGIVSTVVFTGLTAEQKRPLVQHVHQLVRSANPTAAFILAEKGAVTR